MSHGDKVTSMLFNQNVNNFGIQTGTLFSDVTLTANAINTTTLDLNDIKPNGSASLPFHDQNQVVVNRIFIFGKCKKNSAPPNSDAFALFTSHNENDFFLHQAINPIQTNITAEGTGVNTFYHFSYEFNLNTRFIRIGNIANNNLTNFSLHYILLK